MADWMLRVPATLLKDPTLTPSAKLVWIAQRQHPEATRAKLAALTGLTRYTLLQGIQMSQSRSYGGNGVELPAALLAERSVSAQAKVLYALLRTLPTYTGRRGRFTYTTLADELGLHPATLRRAVGELVSARWVKTTQASRSRPIYFRLGTPELLRSLQTAALARRRLKRAEYLGEALMQEWLSLLIDSTYFTDNARPGFLLNPFTDERLELDRFYPPGVAFEFHGSQHFRADGRFSQVKVDEQRKRDLIKAGLCLYEGIHLVIVQAEDLTLAGMLKRLGSCMNLRDLTGQEPLIDLLEHESRRYRARAAKV